MSSHGKYNFTSYTIIAFIMLVLGSMLVLYSINHYTQDRIADNKLQATRKVFNDIIPYQYTNDIYSDRIEVTEPDYLGTNQGVSIYRIRNGDTPLGIIIHPVIAVGYKSEIELGIGISRQGTITGVRVTRENETEGMGDQIKQNKTDWLSIFDGKSFTNLAPELWRVKSENGYFDQLSGATITSRSVIDATRNALNFYTIAEDDLYK